MGRGVADTSGYPLYRRLIARIGISDRAIEVRKVINANRECLGDRIAIIADTVTPSIPPEILQSEVLLSRI